jgi:DNA-binding transcriptional LysR family regulator
MFSPTDLTALIAVADTGSVRGAASVLARTQPTVTQAIHRLEDAVGFPLLDRSGYRARLTERGEIFVKRARMTVNNARGLREFAALLCSGIEPRLRIAIDGAIPPPVWIDLIRETAGRYPDTPLEVQTSQDYAPLHRLETGEADLAVLFDVTVRRRDVGLESRSLGAVEFCNVVRSDRRDQLQDEGAKIPQIYVADFDDPAPGYGSVDGQRHWRVSSHRMQTDAILAGLGWGKVPRAMIEAPLAQGLLVSLPYLGLSEHSNYAYSLYRQRDHQHGPVATHVWDHGHT